MDKREFVITELMVKDFIMLESDTIVLKETEDTGKSILTVSLDSGENLCISNVDQKNTQLLFLQNSSQKSLFKRVDHIIFELLEEDKWRLHLIEMKSSVSAEKWVDIKGKFRASYLLARAIASMLDMEILETKMYTTFERITFSPSETVPAGRRLALGIQPVKMEDEWSGKKFRLNFGEMIKFEHQPIQMIRDGVNGLVGAVRI